ncbi:MAG: DUF2304 domain-containing protein [Acidimicrobiales bacterium]
MTVRTHVLVVAVALGGVAFILGQLRHRRLSAKYAVLWLGLGSGALVVAVFPGILDAASRWLGIPYGGTTAFLVAIVVLTMLSVHYSREVSRLEERSRALAQEVALLRQRFGELESPAATRAPVGPAPAARHQATGEAGGPGR